MRNSLLNSEKLLKQIFLARQLPELEGIGELSQCYLVGRLLLKKLKKVIKVNLNIKI